MLFGTSYGAIWQEPLIIKPIQKIVKPPNRFMGYGPTWAEPIKRKPLKLSFGSNTWRPDIPDSREKYQEYLCSREWGLKRRVVFERANGICERCIRYPGYAVHHLTYIRKYDERLEDLKLLCNPCHEFTHGRSDYDPLVEGVQHESHPNRLHRSRQF